MQQAESGEKNTSPTQEQTVITSTGNPKKVLPKTVILSLEADVFFLQEEARLKSTVSRR